MQGSAVDAYLGAPAACFRLASSAELSKRSNCKVWPRENTVYALYCVLQVLVENSWESSSNVADDGVVGGVWRRNSFTERRARRIKSHDTLSATANGYQERSTSFN